jgi:hypothetical protein
MGVPLSNEDGSVSESEIAFYDALARAAPASHGAAVITFGCCVGNIALRKSVGCAPHGFAPTGAGRRRSSAS